MISKHFAFIAVLMGMTGMTMGQQAGRVTIQGTLTGDLEGYEKMYFYNRMGTDSVQIVDGKYTYTFPFQEPEMKMLLPEYISRGGVMYQPFGILITEPGLYTISSDKAKGLNASTVKGPQSLMVYLDFDKKQKEAYKTINQTLGNLYGDNWYRMDESNDQFTAVQKSRDSLQTLHLLPLLTALVKQHPNSFTSGYVLAANREVGSIEQKEALFGALSPSLRKQGPAKKYGDYIQGLKSSGVGNTVKNFVLPDPQNKPFSLASLRGKYVLIDFWASWCAPCRVSFPRMRELYSHYKTENFEIYSISIDENKEAWLKAVREEANPWPQTLDTKNISQSSFAVTAVPTTFLLDPQGKILIQEIGFDPKGGSEIEKKIMELFGNKMDKPKQSEEKKEGVVPAVRMVEMSK